MKTRQGQLRLMLGGAMTLYLSVRDAVVSGKYS